MDDEFFGKGFGMGRRGFGDFDSFFFNDFNRVFQEVDDMMRDFGLGHFTMIEGPPTRGGHHQQNPAIEAPKQNLRDRFLKDGPSNPEKERNASSFIFPSNHTNHVDRIGNHAIFDEDLDVKIEREGLDKVLREDLFRHSSPPVYNHHFNHNHQHHHHQNPHNHHHSFFHNQHHQPFHMPVQSPNLFAGQAYSVRRTQRPDGSIEEVKTVKNSDGQEEKTVTRIIGDKAHSVIEKKANNQIQETEEIFHNFDEDKIDEFNRMWNQFSTPAGKEKSNQAPLAIKSGKDETTADGKMINTLNSVNVAKSEKNNSPSLFSKLFSWFKK